MSLTSRFRPQDFGQFCGLQEVQHVLRAFVEEGESEAFLFCGAAGSGKTSMAFALARALQVGEWDMHVCPGNGYGNKEDVDHVWDGLHLCTWAQNGKGWRLVLVDEAHDLSSAAKERWKYVLERLPARTMIVFCSDREPDSFLDKALRRRLIILDFGDLGNQPDDNTIKTYLQALAHRETGDGALLPYDRIVKEAEGGIGQAINLLGLEIKKAGIKSLKR